MDPGSERTDYSISLVRANVVGIPLFLALAACVVVPYGVVWGWMKLLLAFNEFMVVRIFLPAIVVGTVVHEGLHGLGWAFFGRLRFRTIRYGFNWKTVTPFAHCPVALPASAYRAGTALPGIALGLFPALAAIITGNGFMIIFAAFFLGAASGDLLCLWIMRGIPAQTPVRDHPSRAGCLVEVPITTEGDRDAA
jgi:hypothetical protein